MNREEFMAVVMALCLVHGGSITSWGRSAQRNKAVGGSPTSKHLTFDALDVVLDDMAKAKREALVVDCRKCNLWALDEGDHIHIQRLPPGPQ